MLIMNSRETHLFVYSMHLESVLPQSVALTVQWMWVNCRFLFLEEFFLSFYSFSRQLLNRRLIFIVLLQTLKGPRDKRAFQILCLCESFAVRLCPFTTRCRLTAIDESQWQIACHTVHSCAFRQKIIVTWFLCVYLWWTLDLRLYFGPKSDFITHDVCNRVIAVIHNSKQNISLNNFLVLHFFHSNRNFIKSFVLSLIMIIISVNIVQ